LSQGLAVGHGRYEGECGGDGQKEDMMKKTILCLALGLIFVLPSTGETTVWKVKSESSEMYIGGTIHVLRESDFPLPAVFDEAYEKAELLVFETDIGKISDPETQTLIINKAVYTDGTTIDKVISTETYSLLEEYCAGIGIPMSAIMQYKPSMIMLTLVAMKLQKLGVTEEGVDKFFYKKATTDEKNIEGFETIEEQIEMIATMGDGIEDDFITHGINEIKIIGEIFEKIIDSWKTGDNDKLIDLLIKEMKEKFPNLYKKMLDDRNIKWLVKLEEYLKTAQTEFVLVGAGHLVGEKGVIEQLKKRGYEVEKLEMKVEPEK
jgi:uncharacterized protein YbaP (TraB family)